MASVLRPAEKRRMRQQRDEIHREMLQLTAKVSRLTGPARWLVQTKINELSTDLEILELYVGKS